MSNTPYSHSPVMCNEIVSEASQLADGWFLDATLGGAGHAQAILKANDDLSLLGVDRDRDAIATATERLFQWGSRVKLVRARFDKIGEILAQVRLSGFLFDLGVSSYQLDTADRGFSYSALGPLDMRMDASEPMSADDVVNGYSADELVRVLRKHSDERFSARIAAAIVQARPISDTSELSKVVVGAIPAAARRTGGHPAKRTFQAIRIEVNGELKILEPALETALTALEPGGKGFVITYHSGEDRIVKQLFTRLSTSSDPQGLPTRADKPLFTFVRPHSRRPTAIEVSENPRSRSARLRVIRKEVA